MVGMRTSMAMAKGSCRKVSSGRWARGGAECVVTRVVRGGRRGSRAVRRQGSSTDGAGEPAQVDVQPRHEHAARRLVAHVRENHAVIVSIPDTPIRVWSHTVDDERPGVETVQVGGAVRGPRGGRQYASTILTSSSVTSPSTFRKERNWKSPRPSVSAVDTST